MRYIHVAPRHVWKESIRHPGLLTWRGLHRFKNRPNIVPGRWGVTLFGLIEIGSREPGDPVGVWLKRKGLWPW